MQPDGHRNPVRNGVIAFAGLGRLAQVSPEVVIRLLGYVACFWVGGIARKYSIIAAPSGQDSQPSFFTNSYQDRLFKQKPSQCWPLRLLQFTGV